MLKNVLRWTCGIPVVLLIGGVILIGLFFFWLFGMKNDQEEAIDSLSHLWDRYLYGDLIN